MLTDDIACVVCAIIVKKQDKYWKLTENGYTQIKEYCARWAVFGVHERLNATIADLPYETGMICHTKCYSYIVSKDKIARYELNVNKETKSEKSSNEQVSAAPLLKEEKSSIDSCLQSYNEQIIEIVKNNIVMQNKTMDMGELAVLYKSILKRAGISYDDNYNYKRYLKNLIQSDPDLGSIEFFNCNKMPSVMASKSFVEDMVSKWHYETQLNEGDSVAMVSKDVRRQLSTCKPWQFTGDFVGYERPPILQKLILNIIRGHPTEFPLSQKKEEELASVSRNVCDYITANFKSDRCLKYQSKSNRGFEKSRLTPLTLGISLLSYKTNRSKTEIDHLFELGLGISYEKIERIVTGIAMAVIKKGAENGLGIFLPPYFVKGIRPIFAADNIDLGSDRKSFHGADLMIAQRMANTTNEDLDLKSITYEKNRSLKFSVQPTEFQSFVPIEKRVTIYSKRMEGTDGICAHGHLSTIIWLLLLSNNFQIESCDVIENEYPNDDVERSEVDNFETVHSSEHSTEETDDDIEGNLDDTERVNREDKENEKKILNVKKTPPSWSAYNSLVSKKSPVSNVAIVPPLFLNSPTNAYILLEIPQRGENVSTLLVGPGKRTIITLDGDLYMRAVTIKDYKKRWIIRLGSLHQIIAALKTLGKYVEDSGIDTAWELSGIFGSATISQIIEGRHVYRGIEAHTITLMSIFHLNLDVALSKKDKETILTRLSQISHHQHKDFSDDTKKFGDFLKSSGIYTKLTESSKENYTAKFLHNYVKQVFNLLGFIQATRNSNWAQHLAESQKMCKYFHAHNQIKYAQWVPLYLADMLELEEEDPESWNFLSEGNFTVAKTDVPFTSLDPDHAIEQLHRGLKVKGGFIGLTQNEKLLDRFALTIPILNMFAESFKNYAGMKTSYGQFHHELVGTMFEKRLVNAVLLTKSLCRNGNPFLFDDLCNLVSFSVPSEEIQKNVANRDVLGAQDFQKYWDSRISEKRTIPYWDPFRKNKYKYFSSHLITIRNAKSSQKTTLQEERILYARMLAVAKTRPDICIRTTIGEYELCSYPPSNFTPNGELIKHNDKFKLFVSLNKLPKSHYQHQCQYHHSRLSVFIVDGMRMVNEIKKTDNMKTGLDFANEFLSRLDKLSRNYNQIRLMFDEYIENSLKNVTRQKRNVMKKDPIHFHINDSTLIANLNQFLGHWKTKHELTKYLGDKIVQFYGVSEKKVLVAYQSKFKANCELDEIISLPSMLTGTHSLEEADQLILLNCVDVSKGSNNVQKLTVYASDTDILVLLISFYKLIPANTEIWRRSGQVVAVGEFYQRLGEMKADALLGWYTFQETDMTGGFAGKAITSHFDAFMAADDAILQAFSQFGKAHTISKFIHEQVQRYVCYLYGKTFTKNICDLRYSLTVQDGREGKKLPPTIGTLTPHLKRSYYMALIWKNSVESLPEAIDPCKFGWFLDESGNYYPVACDKPSAPKVLLQFKNCKCHSSTLRCGRLSCTCLSSGLLCTDLCKCDDLCENRKDIGTNEEQWEESDFNSI